MANRISTVLDHNGRPFTTTNGHARPLHALRQPVRQRHGRPIEAKYDAAQTTDSFKNYWANADALDADSANSKGVRATLVKRSRYEVGNNGYADGITQTYATDLVGTGPKLRVQSGPKAFRREVEAAWQRWVNAVQLRRKLWCMAHAKVQDGEAIGIVRLNPKVKDQVKLDVVLIETEQCQSPQLALMKPGRIDGIEFDEFDNPVSYEILRYHPGGPFGRFIAADPERVDARFILHWFLLRRPGQHRGVPEFRSTLNTGAASRRWREATVQAAESVADMSVVMHTSFQPDEVDAVEPMSTLNFDKGMFTALPQGYTASQIKAEHPNAQYEAFLDAQINETARPKSMPLNKAKCNSASYNFASGRLDHLTYYASIAVDRDDGNRLVLDPLFELWWKDAQVEYDWSPITGGKPPEHFWGWPRHPVADRKSESAAIDTELRNGTLSLTRAYDDMGLDFEDEVQAMVAESGLSEREVRKALWLARFPQQPQQTLPVQASDPEEDDEEEEQEVPDADED